MWLLFFTWEFICVFANGARIPDCESGYIDAVEGDTSFTLTCDRYSGKVDWQYEANPPTTTQDIGTCTEQLCQVNSGLTPFYQLQWLQTFSSRLEFYSALVTSRNSSGFTYKCGDAKCVVPVMVPAELGTPSVVLSRPSQGQQVTVNGTVDITRVYSSRGEYNCTWIRQQGGQSSVVTTKSLFPGPNVNKEDRSGRCDVTDSLDPSSATYTYKVLVYPGATEKTQTVQVDSPPAPSINCTPSTGYVSEDTDVSCTCSGSVGRPAGRLVWVRRNNNVNTRVKQGSYGQNSLQLTMTVNRSHDGDKLRCDVDWVTDTTGPAYTVSVAYGPDSASIPESPVFYTDSTGSQSLTLTCTPRDVNPTTGLTYRWTGRCAGETSDRCSFRPRPPDENGDGDVGATVQCNVTNPFNNKMAETSFVLQLKYPPRVAPHIQGYTDNHVLYQGDPLNINCTVAGGAPPVTSVTLTCMGHSQGPSTGQSSSLRVTSLSTGDHDAVCTCSASWIKPEYYTLTATRTLTVYSPPSEPNLSRIDGMTKPYLEGETVTLTCSVTSSGHPTANLTWSGQENGVIANPDRKTSTLRLLSVGKGDHLRNITCHAVNDFTQHKQRDLSDVETLLVYYVPNITLESSANNTCVMTSDPMTCTTVEGQMVHFRSKADSRPPPQRYVWQAPAESNLDLASGADLDIVSINRTQSGVYRVEVSTTTLDGTDSRLPLTSHSNLTVLVKYTASDVTFGIDTNKILTINEEGNVTFDCQSHGRPTPELQLTQSDTELQREEGGKLSLSEVSTRLSHTISAQCDDTGLYTCSAHNGVGDTQQDTAQLYVNCKPRRNSTGSAKPLEVNYVGKPVPVDFKFVAFPVPDNNSFALRVNDSDITIPDNIKLNATCVTNNRDYDVTCTVIVSDVTNKEAEGMYTFSAANAFGQEDVLFKVIVNGTMGSAGKQTEEFDIAAVAGGIGAALIVIAVVAVVLFIVRHRRKGAKQSQSNLTGSHCDQQREEPEMTVNDLYGTSPAGSTKNADDEVMIVNTAYVSSADIGNHGSIVQGNAYEDVELNSSTNRTGKYVTVPDSTGAQASTSALKYQTTVNTPSNDDRSNLYATVNKGTKPSLGAQGRPNPASGEKQRPDVKPKPAKKSKQVKHKDKPTGKKNTKQDDKQPLQTGVYGNVGMASLTMSPHSQEGSVYENFAFEKEESRRERPRDEVSSSTVNEDGLVYTTVAFSDKQLKKAAEPPPQREHTEYAGIDFTRKAPSIKANE